MGEVSNEGDVFMGEVVLGHVGVKNSRRVCDWSLSPLDESPIGSFDCR